jgi:phenol 2-monooxygenase (NADPH)
MQFHLNGFEPGDPDIVDRSERYPSSGAQGPAPEEVDVLIVGCGPAGLTLAAQLSAFPDIKTCIVEQKPGRMLLGQADGIACHTMEMFHAFGFSERVLKCEPHYLQRCRTAGDAGDVLFAAQFFGPDPLAQPRLHS